MSPTPDSVLPSSSTPADPGPSQAPPIQEPEPPAGRAEPLPLPPLASVEEAQERRRPPIELDIALGSPDRVKDLVRLAERIKDDREREKQYHALQLEVLRTQLADAVRGREEFRRENAGLNVALVSLSPERRLAAGLKDVSLFGLSLEQIERRSNAWEEKGFATIERDLIREREAARRDAEMWKLEARETGRAVSEQNQQLASIRQREAALRAEDMAGGRWRCPFCTEEVLGPSPDRARVFRQDHLEKCVRRLRDGTDSVIGRLARTVDDAAAIIRRRSRSAKKAARTRTKKTRAAKTKKTRKGRR